MSESSSNRRDFLTGRAATQRLQDAVEESVGRPVPTAGHTLRLTQRAMACDFSVILNAGVPKKRVQDASMALDFIADLEQQISVYRPDSELSQLNGKAADHPIPVERELFALLERCRQLSELTDQAFDPTAGPLVALWRACREQDRIPTQEEIDACRASTGIERVIFEADARTIAFPTKGMELNLGGIGKGYALDRAGAALGRNGLNDWLLHGGHSSLLARGKHHELKGWPVGIGNPLFTGKRLGTLLLVDQAMATSGSNIQYFRHQGKKYGHILDPRTGWPVETMLSVTVLAPTAEQADALSTAFYVMGVEKATECCDNLGLGAILIPIPQGRNLEPVVVGIPDDQVFLDREQIAE